MLLMVVVRAAAVRVVAVVVVLGGGSGSELGRGGVEASYRGRGGGGGGGSRGGGLRDVVLRHGGRGEAQKGFVWFALRRLWGGGEPRWPGVGRALQRHPFSGLVDSAGELLHTP